MVRNCVGNFCNQTISTLETFYIILFLKNIRVDYIRIRLNFNRRFHCKKNQICCVEKVLSAIRADWCWRKSLFSFKHLKLFLFLNFLFNLKFSNLLYIKSCSQSLTDQLLRVYLSLKWSILWVINWGTKSGWFFFHISTISITISDVFFRILTELNWVGFFSGCFEKRTKL